MEVYKLIQDITVITDSQGKWIIGYYMRIGISTDNSAELWVVRQRIHLASELGFKFITLDIDFELIISWLTSNAVMALEQAPLIFYRKTILD